IAVAALYPTTNGRLQISSGISHNDCSINVSLAKLPSVINPPPLPGANQAVICRSFFFAWETARWLTISRVTRDGAVTKTVSLYYRLDRNNNLTKGYSIDWCVLLVLFAYLVALESRVGTSVGKRLLGIRVIDIKQPDRTGLPLGKAISRNFLLWIGLYP